MTRAVLSIGSNVGDSLAHLRSVTTALGARLVSASHVYRSAPWGGVEQQDFLNAIVVAEDDAFGSADWLDFGQRLEAAADRVRLQRWGPRSLDVDVVVCDAIVSDDPRLALPHPRAHERGFVLMPWLEIEPDATLRVDGTDVPAADLLASLDTAERAGVVRTDLVLLTGDERGDGSTG